MKNLKIENNFTPGGILKNKLSILFIILFSFHISAQQIPKEKEEIYKEVAEKIVASALKENKGYEWLRELCEIGPRLSGSENSYRAIEWAEKKMKSLGFDTVWLQEVMVPYWVRGEKETAFITGSEKYEGKELNILALGGSISSDGEIEAEVLEVYDYDELEKRKDEAEGKIVFYNYPFKQEFVNTFRGYGDAVKFRSTGAIEAVKHGAVGVIIRSVTSKKDTVPHTGSMRYVDSLPKIPAVAAGYVDSDILSEALKENPDLKVKLKVNSQTLPDTLSYNVIGEIKGSEFPNEVVVVGGHFDSWDVGCGAHDDGSPCMQAMEVLDLFNRLNIKPKRTVRCVLFINEENGIRGGYAYADYADSASEKHVAAIESDRGAFTPEGFTVDSDSITIAKMNEWLPILEKAEILYIIKGGSGVDISRMKNVKALIGYAPDNQRYFDFHHSANDVFEAVHPREMELGTAAIAILAYLISEEGI